jgi:ferredoxin
MAHVVTDKCQRCKFTDCVEVCPVACFYELDGQLVIHADDCIDCTACVEVCPVEAIYAEASVPGEFQASIQFNADEARRVKDSGQEAIATKKDPLPTAQQRKTELGY